MSVSFNSTQDFQMNDQPTTPFRGCAFQPPSSPFARQNLMPYFPPSLPNGPRDFGWRAPGDRPPASANQSGNFNQSMGSWNQGGYYNSSMAFPNQGGNSNNSMVFWNQGSYYNSSMSFPNQNGNGSSSMPFPNMGGNANFSMGSWNQGNYFNSSMPIPGQIGYSDSSTSLPNMSGNANLSMGSWNQGNYLNSSMPFPGQIGYGGSSMPLPNMGGSANLSMGSWNQGSYFNSSMPFPGQNGSCDSSTALPNQGGSCNGSTALPEQGGGALCPPDNGQRNAWSDTGVNDNKSSINLGDYTMDLDKSNSSLTLTDPRTGNQTKVWGDPHVDFDANTSNPASTMADGPIKFTLPGDKQVFVNTQPSGSSAPAYASDVYVVQGDRAYEVHGLSEKDDTPLSVNYVPYGGADLGQQAPQGLKNYIASPNGMIDADTNRPARESISA